MLSSAEGMSRVLLIVGRVPGVPALRGPVRPSRDRRHARSPASACFRRSAPRRSSSRASISGFPTGSSGAVCSSIASALVISLVVTLASGVRVADAAASGRASACCSSARAAAAVAAGARAVRASPGARRRDRRLHRSRSGARRRAGHQSRRDRRRSTTSRGWCPALNVDRVVVSLADARGRLPMDRLLDIRLRSGVTFDHLASVYEEYTGKIAVENLRPSWLIFSEGFRKTRPLLAAKRALDLVAGLHRARRGRPADAAGRG